MVKIPEAIAIAARERVRASKPERERVLAAVKTGQPLTAEKDLVRKVHRIQTISGSDMSIAERLAHNEPAAQLGLVGESRRAVECIQGSKAAFISVCFLELALA